MASHDLTDGDEWRRELWCTLGPASVGREAELIAAGATGFRLTFSFATTEVQETRARAIRAAAAGRPCRVVADLAGGKPRLGTFVGPPSRATRSGDRVRLTTTPTDPQDVPVAAPDFLPRLRVGDVVVVGDGAASLRVTAHDPDGVWAEATAAGVIDQCRGLSVAGGAVEPDCLTDKDRGDLAHIAAAGVYDAVALSFAGSADDVAEARGILLGGGGGRQLPIIAKVETVRGLTNLGSLCATADVIMAARGDLAWAVGWVELPAAVQAIATAAGRAGKPWVLATQVAEGLERFATPTRAEICDAAHWLGEGCGGMLLSYETAFGRDPLAAVRCVAELLRRWSA